MRSKKKKQKISIAYAVNDTFVTQVCNSSGCHLSLFKYISSMKLVYDCRVFAKKKNIPTTEWEKV